MSTFGYHELPYGVWTLPDGTEIAFNRSYKALWLREPSGRVERMKPSI